MPSEMGIRENIRKEIIRLGYGNNFKKFCQDYHLPNSYMNLFLNGKRRYNERFLNQISEALNIPAYQLLADKPVVPYVAQEPRLIFEVRDQKAPYGRAADYEAIKFFPDPISLGPGYELSEIPPEDFAPILKRFLPRGYKSDSNRIVAYPTKGMSMNPIINDGSIVWIDRLDQTAREGEIYAFLLPDKTVTIKRLLKVMPENVIIDGDNRDPEARKSEDLREYPRVVQLDENVSIIRGRVIWILNRLIEQPAK